MRINEFQIDVSQATLTDLKGRLARTRWNDAVTDNWDYGMARGVLQKLVGYWSHEYDWSTRQSGLNQLPHFRASIDGVGIHFLYFKGRGPSPQPLLLANGWPSSFVEYQRLAPILADPARFGGDPADAFHVVIPALPGFGFSDRPQHPREALRGVDLFFQLMTEGLGYRRFVAAGTDIGADVATRLGLAHPDVVAGIHVTSVANPPMDEHSPPLTLAEGAYHENYKRWVDEEGAYSAVQSTRPQTLAFGLADSPAGLASWIVEKFYFWGDCRGDLFGVFPMDMLIDNPTAVLMLPKDLLTAPREWAERFYNVKRYNVFDRGGHFPAWEVTNPCGIALLQNPKFPLFEFWSSASARLFCNKKLLLMRCC